jgi:hypothetical protein
MLDHAHRALTGALGGSIGAGLVAGVEATLELTAAAKASSLSGSLRPGADSTPLATSTAYGRTATMASETLSGVKPPERITGTFLP